MKKAPFIFFIVVLGVGMILPALLSTQSSNKEAVGKHYGAAQAVVTVPAKQSHFFVTEDYQKALKYLNKGYVLQDVTNLVTNGGYKYRYYTMVKYAR